MDSAHWEIRARCGDEHVTYDRRMRVVVTAYTDRLCVMPAPPAPYAVWTYHFDEILWLTPVMAWLAKHEPSAYAALEAHRIARISRRAAIAAKDRAREQMADEARRAGQPAREELAKVYAFTWIHADPPLPTGWRWKGTMEARENRRQNRVACWIRSGDGDPPWCSDDDDAD